MSDSSGHFTYEESYPIAEDALPSPFYVYGEPHRLALDAALPKRTLRDIFATPQFLPSVSVRRPMVTDENKEDENMDYDMKVKVLTYLREKLEPDELKEVASLLGTEVETTGMDRRRSGFRGASDRRPVHTEAVTYDATTFPHAARLKR